MLKARTQNQFTQACHIKDVTFDIFNKNDSKALHLTTNEVIEAEISFNGFSVYSYLVINDHIDVQFQLNNSQNLGFISFFLDFTEKYYRREFQVIGTNKKRELNTKTISFAGRDIVSYILDNLYISKTYKNKTLAFIFKDIFETYVKPNLKLNNLNLNIKSNIIIESFTLTSQNSVLNLITDECNRQGLAFFQDKKSITIIPYKELKPQNLISSNIQYKNYLNDPNSPFDILSHNVTKSNRDTKIPKALVFAYDKSNKTMKIMSQNLEELGISYPKGMQNTEGFEYVCQEYLHNDNLFAETYKSFMNDSQIEIVVPGLVDNIMLFRKYDIVLRAGEVKDEEYTGDIIDSGKYILINYVDKLMSSRYYITKLSLVRFDDTNVK